MTKIEDDLRGQVEKLTSEMAKIRSEVDEMRKLMYSNVKQSESFQDEVHGNDLSTASISLDMYEEAQKSVKLNKDEINEQISNSKDLGDRVEKGECDSKASKESTGQKARSMRLRPSRRLKRSEEHSSSRAIQRRSSLFKFFNISEENSQNLSNYLGSIVNSFLKQGEEKAEISPSIHTYTIFAVCKKHWLLAWFMLLVSFSFISIQIIVFQSAILDLSTPTCSAHKDCQLGQYCANSEAWYASENRCVDCNNDEFSIEPSTGTIYYDYNGKTVNCASYSDEISYLNSNILNDRYALFEDNINPEVMHCLAYAHCDISASDNDGCDSIILNKLKLSLNFLVTLAFLAYVGLAPVLTNEVEEAMEEETILDRTLKESGSSIRFIAKIAGQAMFILLRIRCYMIPFLAATATASIIIGSEFSVQNLLLNILSIVFLTQIDNLSIGFFLPPPEVKEVTQFMEEAGKPKEKGDDTFTFLYWLWSRIISVSACSIMIISIVRIGSLFQLTSCSDSYWQLLLLLVFTTGLFSLLHALGVLLKSKACVDFLIDLARNVIAFSYVQLMIHLLGVSVMNDFRANISISIFVLAGFVLVLCLFSYVLLRISRRARTQLSE